MSYTPTTWAAGDTVTATKLNNMETGIGNAVNKFIVTLTPTAADFSGTMDKTVAEIYAAYQAGKQIVFRLHTAETASIDVYVSLIGSTSSETYPSFEGYVIQPSTNLLIWAGTGVTSDGSRAAYISSIYSITPAT